MKVISKQWKRHRPDTEPMAEIQLPVVDSMTYAANVHPPMIIVFNPVAGMRRASLLWRVLDVLVANGIRIELAETHRPGHAEALAREAVCRGASMVVAAGGDGTIAVVANGLLGSPARLEWHLLLSFSAGVWIATAYKLFRMMRNREGQIAPAMPTEERFQPAVMIRMPMRNHERAQFFDRNL